jgi:molybdate transport system substrate-binding protein
MAMNRRLALGFSALLVGFVWLNPIGIRITAAAEIKCMCSVALKPGFAALIPDFEKSSGHKVTFVYDTVGALTDRIQKGEATDVAIVAGAQIDSLQQQGKVVPGPRHDVAKVGIGAYVRKGGGKPDLSSVDSLKRSLLDAKSIAYADPAGGAASGIYFASLLDRLGVAAQMKSKSNLYRDYALDGPLYTDVASGKVEMGFLPISEIIGAGIVEYAGPLPPAVQFYVLFSAGIGTSSKQPDAAKALIEFVTSPSAQASLKSRGYEVPQ